MSHKIEIEKFRNILLPRFDTFGDIVLLQGFIKALLDLLPEASITLLVRNGYEQLKELFPDLLIWKTVNIINPHKGEADPKEARILLEKLNGDSYDMVLFTTYDRTWADDIVAAKLTSALRVVLGEPGDIHDNVLQIMLGLGIERSSCPYDEFVSVEERIPETEKYQIFWQLLRGNNELLSAPHLSISKDTEELADEILKALNLTQRSFIFCFPRGTANVSHKFWPGENFARVISDLEKKFDLRTLVVGHESEKEAVEKVVKLAGQQGADPKSWLGKDGDIPLVCALAKKSLFYLGNDTGPMHMAAALNKPVIAIFGGGHWPRFVPCAKVGRVFFSPTPCFYCGWKCVFGEALCMSSLSPDAIIGEIKAVVEDILKGKGDYQTVEIKPDRRRQYTIIEKAVGCLRRSENAIELFKTQVEDLFERLDKCELDREVRLKTIQDIGLKLDSAEAERDARMEVIKRQQKEFSKKLKEIEDDRSERLEAIRQLSVMLDSAEAQSKARMVVIKRQEKEYSEKLKEIEADRAARLEVIHDLGRRLDSAKAELDARMEVIKHQETEYTKKIKEIEEDREARLQVIERQQKEFSEKVQEIEADRGARLEVIKALGKQNEDKAQKISELQDFDIRSLGFTGAFSYFLRKLGRVFLRTKSAK
jgi:ADP-heptose:LPS heptosyltransferase